MHYKLSTGHRKYTCTIFAEHNFEELLNDPTTWLHVMPLTKNNALLGQRPLRIRATSVIEYMTITEDQLTAIINGSSSIRS